MTNQPFSDVKRLTLVAVLGGLGTVLMLFEIPFIFMAIDLSDVVILVAFFLLSWKDALVVAVIKTVAHILFKGAVGPLAIGQISAFIASSAYVFGLLLARRVLRMRHRFITGLFTVCFVTIVMVIANYFLVTPVFLGLSLSEAREAITPSAFEIHWLAGGYLLTIVFVFTIFNFLKGTRIMTVYFIMEPAIIAYYDKQQ